MSANTSIEWTDTTWNPVRGCELVSPGCTNCYAMKQAHRFSGPGKPYEGLTKLGAHGPMWNGHARPVHAELMAPLSWHKPKLVFVNSMSDLFHEKIPFAFIASVFGVMRDARRHVFQVLTKRPARMLAFLEWQRRTIPTRGVVDNVWLGVSVENQKTADERVPLLLQADARIRFISLEPMLGPVDLGRRLLWRPCSVCKGTSSIPVPGGGKPCASCLEHQGLENSGIGWVIIGGESGGRARPFDINWGADVVVQCKAAGVPVFVKQLGRVPVMDEAAWRRGDPTRLLSAVNRKRAPEGTVPIALSERKGKVIEEWPVDLQVREFPKGVDEYFHFDRSAR